MSPKPETLLSNKIRQAILTKYGKDVFIFKVHGNNMQMGGIPDLLLCFKGQFIGLEVKLPSAPGATDLQRRRIEEIQVAGGRACVVRSPEEALNFLAPVMKSYEIPSPLAP